ncbi:TIGR04086 family membrane protein [Gracilibacillus timonensis]|uniref:TIGR04086 family membrane protein n=1 Tax=Gracilibacillus timonensis TaxID=1816696 RepID=UPI000825618E|nr:TIGR04086 family membrane protein [Gracilibacillus timonensis]
MRMITGAMYGSVCIFTLMIIASVILSFLLRFTSLGESTLSLAVLFLSFFALFTGGLIAGLKSKQKGIVVGLITGLLFSLIVCSYRFLGLGEAFSVVEIVHHAAFLLLAMIGAVIGVNLAKPEEAS